MLKKWVLILWVVFLCFMVISMVIKVVTYNRSFPRFDRHDDTINATLRYTDIESSYPRTLTTFVSGDNNLRGYIYHQDDALGLIVISHGLGGGADSYLPYMKWFYDQGWSIFMYDATGSFDSEGDSTIGFPQSVKDLEAALHYIRSNQTFDGLDICIFGHSWGGYAAINVLHLVDDIIAVISVAAPNDANTFIFDQVKESMGLFAYTQKPFLSLYQNLKFGAYTKLNGVDAINQTDAKIMIIQGIKDEIVTYDHTALYAKQSLITNEEVSFILIEDEGRNGHQHLFRSDDAISYIEAINVSYRALYDAHHENIPYEVKQSFYEDIDRYRVQALDEALMMMCHDHFMNALDQS